MHRDAAYEHLGSARVLATVLIRIAPVTYAYVSMYVCRTLRGPSYRTNNSPIKVSRFRAPRGASRSNDNDEISETTEAERGSVASLS